MCGICGKLMLRPGADPVDAMTIRAMMQRLVHRGPDEEGLYLAEGIGLGHRRLNIIDLSTGKQPMSNEDGTVWLVFNGEIYNYKELRSHLLAKGHRFRTASDTEVIVHLYEEVGVEGIGQLCGMFSFALWDEKRKTLILARDRVGIKPLYYCATGQSLVFASEIKSILADPSVTAEADPIAIDSFLSYFFIPGEATPFKNILKLLPGHYLDVQAGQIRRKRYWDLHFSEPHPSKTVDDYAEELSDLLRTTVEDHMIADVPVGILLSGGVDSTATLSFAVQHSTKPISTFTVGFDGPGITDERPYARLAAQQYGTTHHAITISSRQFLDWLPSYVWHMEEPVCEPPAIALYYVTKYARDHVTVLISGEGGDEAFAGYQNYRNMFWLETVKSVLGGWSGPASRLMSTLGNTPPLARLKKYAPLMSTPLQEYYYSRTSSPFWAFNPIKTRLYTADFQTEIQNGNGNHWYVKECAERAVARNTLDTMLYVDTKTWLPDDLLIKADRMSMANSLELRVPLLDHRVLEFAAALPRKYKLHGVTTKYLLKKAMSKRVPASILHRKKTGFPVPYPRWIGKDFKEDLAEILTDRRTIDRGYFRKHEIEQLLLDHSCGVDRSKELFSLAVLEIWHRTFLDGTSAHSACPPTPLAV